MGRVICGHCGGEYMPGRHRPGCTNPFAHAPVIASAGFGATPKPEPMTLTNTVRWLLWGLWAEMWRDGWEGRLILAIVLITLMIGALIPFVLWQDAHDGKRCVEQRFSHFQTMIAGKVIINQPVYKCVRWVEDPRS